MLATRAKNLVTVIDGLFRKHLGEIYKLKWFLEKSGIPVLWPAGNGATNPNKEFISLDNDLICQ